MTILLWCGAGLVAYVALSAWVVFGRGQFRFVYNPAMALLLRVIQMAAITIGARCYVAKIDYLALVTITGTFWKHEYRHYRQWRAHPFTFAAVYLYRLARYGYHAHPDENDANAAERAP